MKRFALFFLACVAACRPADAPARAVTLPSLAATPAPASPPSPKSRPPTSRLVVTGAPYAALALWRSFATGKIERVPFPWAELSIIDSLAPSPDGRDVAYAEGGTAYGPLLVRALADGSKTVVAPHVAGRELLVVAWSPGGRRVLYAERRAGRLRPQCDFSGCPPPGPSSYFVFDRAAGTSTKIDVPGELAAWLPSGELIVAHDGALARVAHGAKTPVAVGPYLHGDFALDAAGGRLLSTGWDEATKHDELLALDLATWRETPIAPPAPYATYLAPRASPSGKRVGWLAASYARHVIEIAPVVDGRAIAPPARDLVGFDWIDENTVLVHRENRLEVADAGDGTIKGSVETAADDTRP